MTSELSKYLNEKLGETTKMKLAKNIKKGFENFFENFLRSSLSKIIILLNKFLKELISTS